MQAIRQYLGRAFPLPSVRYRVPLPNLALFGAAFSLLLGAILAVPLTRTALIEQGLPSPITVEAPHDLTYISETETRAAQQAALNDPSNIAYTTDGELPATQRAALVATLESIDTILADPALDRDQRITALLELTSVSLSPDQARAIAQLDRDAWQRVANETRKLYDQILRDRGYALTEQAVNDVRTRILPFTPQPGDFTTIQRELLIYFTGAFLRANRTVDQNATERNRAQNVAAVKPVTRSIARGENVVRRGDIVSESAFEALTKYGLVRGAGGLVSTLQQFALGMLVGLLFTVYLNSCQQSVLKNGRALTVLGGLLLVVVLTSRLLVPNWGSVPYLFPFATVSILLAVIYNTELALIATLIVSPLVGLQSDAALGLSLTLALGGAAGIFMAKRAQRTSTFAWIGLAVAVVTVLAGMIFWVDYEASIQWEVAQLADNPVLRIIIFGLINGALSAVLALGSSLFLSRAANVVTPQLLMELGHPSHPLLRRLMREAPGTYHHSIVVSNLAEVAAENIGADPLLCRVGAYYHDVGKMLRPYFFTDNQHDRSNVHDQLDAKTSASIIIDHVCEGMKVAREYNLPQQIIDFIPQHHGTNVVSYFYRRAIQEDEEADIKAFRYPGPKPQTREAAILMLADGVEAAVRAKSQAGKLGPARVDDDDRRNGNTIEETVEQIVNERIAAQQLDESPLTLHDIAIIKESFERTLKGIYHPRVDYTKQRVRETV